MSAEWEAEGLQLTDADLAKLRAATTRFVKLDSGWVRRDVTASARRRCAALLADLGIELGGGDAARDALAARRRATRRRSRRSSGSAPIAETLARRARAARAGRELRRPAARCRCRAGSPASCGRISRHGLDFLAHASSLGVGAVLADDMGLGKTVQALAWLAHLREREPGRRPEPGRLPGVGRAQLGARGGALRAGAARAAARRSGESRHALRREIARARSGRHQLRAAAPRRRALAGGRRCAP